MIKLKLSVFAHSKYNKQCPYAIYKFCVRSMHFFTVNEDNDC